MSLVAPHGGKLVNRILEPTAATAAAKESASLQSLTLSPREQFDLEMIAIGAFSPLTGFMGKSDFVSVCKEMRLANGTVWPITVTLCPSDEVEAKINVGQKLALKDEKGRLLAIFTVQDKYPHDKALFASDCPFDQEKGPGYIRETIKIIDALDISKDLRDAIYYKNFEKLTGRKFVK